MIRDKQKLIETLQYIIQSSKSKEEAFEKIDYMINVHLTKDDCIDIIIDFIAMAIVCLLKHEIYHYIDIWQRKSSRSNY